MKSSNVYANPYPQEVRAAIYCRLSKDDDQDGPSASIQNQRELLCRYCDEQGWRVTGLFQDDGYSGLSMDRPDFQKNAVPGPTGNVRNLPSKIDTITR